MSTHLSQTIDITTDIDKDKAKYDASVKEVLADKQILARILKYTLEEFADDEIEQIIQEMDEPYVSKVRMEPGQTNLNKIERSSEEDNVLGEGKIFYDIRFSVYHGSEHIKILINVEAQKSSKPGNLGYKLDNRIIYYLGRMISSQKEVEFTKSNYDDLKHVRSIWICMDSADEEDSINRMRLTQETVYGKEMQLDNLDKVVGVIIRLRKNERAEVSKNQLIAMLEELLKKDEIDPKKKKLMSEYGLVMDDDTERRLGEMCNLSDLLVEDGMKRGFEQGIEQGIERGIEQGIERGIEQGIERGIEQGIEKGEDRLNKLNSYLIESNRMEDLQRAIKDKEYRTILYAEFHL